jgi:para-aminobenzoate synthetase component 2
VSPSGAPVHGKVSSVLHDGRGVLRGVPSPFAATRYHSLLVEAEGLPEVLEISARTEAGEIMGLRHRHLPIEGLQFHPESILTEHGPQLVQNWLSSL